MRNCVLFLFFSLTSLVYSSNPTDDTLAKKPATTGMFTEEITNSFCKNVVGRLNPLTMESENYILDPSLYYYKVDALPQVKFWREIMNLHHDSAIITFASSRERISKVCIKEWDCQSEVQKKNYRDSVRLARNVDSSNRILFTTGKKFFYDFDKTSLNFNKGISCFMNNNVDPWYAQAILLIESPNKLQKSNVGAYGPFQLMKGVAKMYGLKVNSKVDERANFERSAYAASSLIKYICIPYAHRMLDSVNIKNYSEEELWFKLLVMHIYHAGASNVQKALLAMSPAQGNMELIYTLWQTQAGSFKSASQNYSQLVLAAMLEMNERSQMVVKVVRD